MRRARALPIVLIVAMLWAVSGPSRATLAQTPRCGGLGAIGFNGGFNLGGFQFGAGGFNFGGGGFNFGLGGLGGLGFNAGFQGGFQFSSFGFNFGGQPGCATGVFGLIPDAATIGLGEPITYRVTWVSPGTWHDLAALDLRIRDERGVVIWVRWEQGTDRFGLVDPATGQVVRAGSPGGDRLEGPAASLLLAETFSVSSGPTGQAVGLNLVIVPRSEAADRELRVEVQAVQDDGTLQPFELAGLLRVVGPAQAKPDDDTDDRPRLTEEQRQQRERTNRAGLDDYRTEGNVVSIDCAAGPPTVTIANRDGDVTLLLLHEAAAECERARVGDYAEAIGEKQHEQLYEAHQLTLRRGGSRVR